MKNKIGIENLSIIVLGFCGTFSLLAGCYICLTGYGNELTHFLGIISIPFGILALIVFIVCAGSKFLGINPFTEK